MKIRFQLLALSLLAISFLFIIPLLSTGQAPVSAGVVGVFNDLIISEVVTKNGNILLDEDGDSSDYLELYNTGDEPLSLKGYCLTDNPDRLQKWVFPNVTLKPHTYLIVFASGKDKTLHELHTNFKLSENGDKLALSDSDGKLLQTLLLDDALTNMSYALGDDGTYRYFTTGTPGRKSEGIVIHNLAEYKKKYSISFSEIAGFYETPIEVKLTATSPEVTIHYTLDGSDPTYESPIYEDPLQVKAKDFEPLLYANIPSTYWDVKLPSSSDVFKGTVIKAQAFSEKVPLGEMVANTYFITPLGSERYSLPVVSLTTDPSNFFDPDTGIYRVGSMYEKLVPGYADGATQANYNQRGRDWERPIHLEYFDAGKMVFEQNLGARTMGGWSRANAKKSFKLYARDSYENEKKTMDFPFFDDLLDKSDKPIEAFNRIVLRSGGNDWNTALLRDPFMQSLVSDTVDTQAAKPVILFINGEYWGAYFLNESQDQYYIADHYGINAEDVSIMTYTIDPEIYVGVPEDKLYYEKMDQFIQDQDLSTPENYEVINTYIDLDNYIEYYVSQIYFCNTDWPSNNMKFWRMRTDSYQPDAPEGQDGRYRFLLYDTDFGFGLYGDRSSALHDTLAFAAAEGVREWPNPEWSTYLFRKLLKNETFKQKFINCMADNLNIRFSTPVVTERLDYYKTLLKPEIEEESKRFEFPNEQTWENSTLAVLYNFAQKRPDALRKHLLDFFELEEAFQLTLQKSNPLGGSVLLNHHISVLENNDTTPFIGTYFSEVPITLKALPNKGYRFVRWEGDINGEDPSQEVTMPADLSITAVFEKK